jgi:hypothetical protein
VTDFRDFEAHGKKIHIEHIEAQFEGNRLTFGPNGLLTPVAGWFFGPLCLSQKSGSEFSDEILRSALLDIQPTLDSMKGIRLTECWTLIFSNCRPGGCQV